MIIKEHSTGVKYFTTMIKTLNIVGISFYVLSMLAIVGTLGEGEDAMYEMIGAALIISAIGTIGIAIAMLMRAVMNINNNIESIINKYIKQ
jgi:hypothetical protein